MSNYVVYILKDPRSGIVRYVGKSCSGMTRPKQHAYPSMLKNEAGTHKTNWINSLLKLGLKPEIELLEDVGDPKSLGEAEKFWIAYFRKRGTPLVNATEGGDGQSPGYVPSRESRIKGSLAHGGWPFQDQFGNVYISRPEAAKKLNFPAGTIGHVLKGRRRQYKGYVFTYLSRTPAALNLPAS